MTFTLRPQALGGPAGYVLVRGVSMEPGYHTADLVIVRPQPAYEVGDIVAYRVPEGDVGAGVMVIHRIVGGSASEGFVMQGDNNASPDDWRPRPGDVVGSAWFSLPGAGALLQWLHSPLVLASMAAGIAAAVIAAPGEGTCRGLRRRERSWARRTGRRDGSRSLTSGRSYEGSIRYTG